MYLCRIENNYLYGYNSHIGLQANLNMVVLISLLLGAQAGQVTILPTLPKSAHAFQSQKYSHIVRTHGPLFLS